MVDYEDTIMPDGLPRWLSEFGEKCAIAMQKRLNMGFMSKAQFNNLASAKGSKDLWIHYDGRPTQAQWQRFVEYNSSKARPGRLTAEAYTAFMKTAPVVQPKPAPVAIAPVKTIVKAAPKPMKVAPKPVKAAPAKPPPPPPKPRVKRVARLVKEVEAPKEVEPVVAEVKEAEPPKEVEPVAAEEAEPSPEPAAMPVPDFKDFSDEESDDLEKYMLGPVPTPAVPTPAVAQSPVATPIPTSPEPSPVAAPGVALARHQFVVPLHPAILQLQQNPNLFAYMQHVHCLKNPIGIWADEIQRLLLRSGSSPAFNCSAALADASVSDAMMWCYNTYFEAKGPFAWAAQPLSDVVERVCVVFGRDMTCHPATFPVYMYGLHWAKTELQCETVGELMVKASALKDMGRRHCMLTLVTKYARSYNEFKVKSKLPTERLLRMLESSGHGKLTEADLAKPITSEFFDNPPHFAAKLLALELEHLRLPYGNLFVKINVAREWDTNWMQQVCMPEMRKLLKSLNSVFKVPPSTASRAPFLSAWVLNNVKWPSSVPRTRAELDDCMFLYLWSLHIKDVTDSDHEYVREPWLK